VPLPVDETRREGAGNEVKRRTSVLIVVTGCVLAAGTYAASPALRAEAHAAMALVARADIAPLREYLLGFGWWAPVLSVMLQIVTSILAPFGRFGTSSSMTHVPNSEN
jgi:uncharacterized membrane protein YdjX (TVP38/TMEM64 family)